MVPVITKFIGLTLVKVYSIPLKTDKVFQCHTNVEDTSGFLQVLRFPPTIKLTVIIKLNNFVIL